MDIQQTIEHLEFLGTNDPLSANRADSLGLDGFKQHRFA